MAQVGLELDRRLLATADELERRELRAASIETFPGMYSLAVELNLFAHKRRDLVDKI
jgi:hypothetical protein